MQITDELVERLSVALINYRTALEPQKQDWLAYIADPANAERANEWRRDIRLCLEAWLPIIMELKE